MHDKEFNIDFNNFITDVGDRTEARISQKNRKVAKASKPSLGMKYSYTEYPNGTIVEAKSRKKNKNN